MATFEEKILAYLDGSLPADGRDELLAGISGSGAHAAEHRALLDEHLRLAELMALVQKPVSAPIALQRDLASKVPVLAMKLPYLAAEQKRRGSAFAGWFAPVRTSSINSILFVALAIIAGCVWFAVNRRDAVTSGDAASSTSSNANGQIASAYVSSSQNSPQNISPANSNSNGSGNPGSADGSLAQSNRVEVSHPRRADRSSGNTGNNGGNILNSSRIAGAVSSTIKDQSDGAIQDGQDQGENSGSKLTEQNSQPENLPKEPERELLSVQIPSSPPAEMIGSGSSIHSLSAMNEPEENNDPLRVFASEEYRFIKISPQAALSDFSRDNGLQTNSLGFESMEFGIDYALDPWISIGLRGGDARFVQEQAVTTLNAKTSGYQYLGREVRETILLDPFAAWFGPAVTYSLPTSQYASFTGSLAAGDALVTALAGAFSPILRGEFAFLYDLNSAFALRVAASYEADWMPSATPLNLVPINPATTSGVVVGSNAATHESQVFGVSVGVTFHP